MVLARIETALTSYGVKLNLRLVLKLFAVRTLLRILNDVGDTRTLSLFFVTLFQPRLVVEDMKSAMNFLVTVLRLNKSKKPAGAKEVPRVPIESKPMNFLFGNVLDVKKSGLHEAQMKWYNDLGSDIIGVRFMHRNFVFTTNAVFADEVFGPVLSSKFIVSQGFRRALGSLLPTSIAAVDGEKWKRIRNVFVRAVHTFDYGLLTHSTNEVVINGLDKFMDGKESKDIKLWDFFGRVTFDSFHKFAYNVNFNTLYGSNLEFYKELVTLAHLMAQRVFELMPFMWKLPTQRSRKLDHALTFVMDHVDELVTKREKEVMGINDLKPTTFLDALIVASNDTTLNSKSLTKEELNDQLVTAMFGGFDTTTSTTSFVLVTLAENPAEQEKLYEEVKDINWQTVDYKTISELFYLNACIKEATRLLRVAQGLSREAIEDVVVQGYFIPKGTTVYFDQRGMARMDEYFPQGELTKFKPDRWRDFLPVPGTYLPFGAGARRCPGSKIADAQLQCLVGSIVQKYIVSLGAEPIKYARTIGESVHEDSALKFTKRK